MDSFRYQLYALIFYYFYFASGIDSHWKIQEVFSVSNLWMAEPSFSGINTKKKMTEKLVLLTKYNFFALVFKLSQSKPLNLNAPKLVSLNLYWNLYLILVNSPDPFSRWTKITVSLSWWFACITHWVIIVLVHMHKSVSLALEFINTHSCFTFICLMHDIDNEQNAEERPGSFLGPEIKDYF